MYQVLDEYIDDHKDDLLSLLAKLVAFPTLSPPGRNTAGAQRFVAEFFSNLGAGIDVFDVYPGDPNVVAKIRGAEGSEHRSLLFNGHIDVAEVGLESKWAHPPFQATLDGGRVYGRGTADMKGGLAAAMLAAMAVLETRPGPLGDLLFEVVVGEESGEAGTQSCNERGYRADFAVVPEPTSLVPCGQGGVITGWITVQSPDTLHDGVRARTLHAGGGVFGANAIEKMMKVISSLQELERHWAVMKSYPGFAPGTTTINPAVIEGGRHPAFMADRCALWCTVHFYPNETYQHVVKEVEDHVLRASAADPWLAANPPSFSWGGASMIEERGEVFPALQVKTESAGVRALLAAHEEVTGNRPAVAMWPSVSDAGWLASAGIPSVIYGPGELAQAHTVNESVDFEELLTASKVYARLIGTFCNQRR